MKVDSGKLRSGYPVDVRDTPFDLKYDNTSGNTLIICKKVICQGI